MYKASGYRQSTGTSSSEPREQEAARFLLAGPRRLAEQVRRHDDPEARLAGDVPAVEQVGVPDRRAAGAHQEHVRPLEQPVKRLQVSGAGWVEHSSPLAAVPHMQSGLGAGRSAARRIYLDDVGTEVCQQHAGDRSCQAAG